MKRVRTQERAGRGIWVGGADEDWIGFARSIFTGERAATVLDGGDDDGNCCAHRVPANRKEKARR